MQTLKQLKVDKKNEVKKLHPHELRPYLKGLKYPCFKEDILNCAIKNGADKNVIYTLNLLPDYCIYFKKDH